jgi:hypothetical protein
VHFVPLNQLDDSDSESIVIVEEPTVEPDPRHSIALGRNVDISSLQPTRLHETAELIDFDATKPEQHASSPGSHGLALSRALGNLNNLMSQMSAAANEASEMVGRQTFHTPASSPLHVLGSSSDGSTDDYPTIETPDLSTLADVPVLNVDESNSHQSSEHVPKHLPTHRVYRPKAGIQRDREPTILLNSPHLYPKGGAADGYYRDWAYSNRDAIVKHKETESPRWSQHNQVPPKKRKPSMYVGRDQHHDQVGREGVLDEIPISPLGRTSTTSFPWIPPTNLESDIGLRQSKSDKLPINLHKTSVSSSEPLLAFTKHGHISHVRHQPIARKWSQSRKRFTAAVACVNTFLVGFQIGIYVSYGQFYDWSLLF